MPAPSSPLRTAEATRTGSTGSTSRSQPSSSPSLDASAGGTAHIVGGKSISVTGRLVRTARLADEWYEDVDEPELVVAELRRSGINADLFTFWQRLPNSEPRYGYHSETDSIAVLPVGTYENWHKSQINNKTRNLVLKAKKKGVVVRPAAFDDDFVRGMATIFNETPIRQERRFIHYGKSESTIKEEFSRYLFREELLGAYWEDELIGFVMLADAGRYMMLGQIISMVQHRDKSPNNALIAKAVEVCAERRVPHLVYALWPRGPLREFKRHNGFEEVRLPRYYIPLNQKGRLALLLNLHRKIVDRLPERAIAFGREMRSRFYAYRYRAAFQNRIIVAPSPSAGAGPHSDVQPTNRSN